MAANLRARRGGGDTNQNPNLRDVNVTVDDHGLDIVIPTISRPNKADTMAGFKFQVLTVIKNKPTYEKMKEIASQLARNALTVKVSSGGSKHGVLALVIGDDKFLKETQHEWLITATQGVFPNIAANASAINKKKTTF